MAKDLGEVNINQLRKCVKLLNEVVPEDEHLQATGKKEDLVEKFTTRIEELADRGITIPQDAADFYNWFYEDEMDDAPEPVEPERPKPVEPEPEPQEAKSEDTAEVVESEDPVPDEPVESREAAAENEEEVEAVVPTPPPSPVSSGNKFNREALLEILDKINPALSTKFDLMSRYHFLGNVVCTINDNIHVSHPLTTGFKCSVKGMDFFNVLKNIETGEVEIDLIKSELMLSASDISAGFLVGDEPRFDDMVKDVQDEVGKAQWKGLPLEFCEGVKLTSFSAAPPGAGTSSCIKAEGDTIVTSQSFRGSLFTMVGNVDNMMFPAAAAMKLVATQPREYAVTDSWIHFRNENGLIFSTRKITGSFPDIESIISNKAPEANIDLPEGLKRDLRAVIALAEKKVDSKAMYVSINEGEIRCRVQSDRGWVVKKGKIDYEGTVADFCINPEFLYHALEKGVVRFGVGPDMVRLETDNFIHVLAMKQ